MLSKKAFLPPLNIVEEEMLKLKIAMYYSINKYNEIAYY